ncbi:hypothetical protein ZEAMMB73_Zm00001d049385 [Zea mays]|uniref:Uncharacterized protein n=1 Tax=Zea mays TaxID=4577 RepID=A0A1D6PUD2_MAIZE|nr:hypothetical protein ZEAMMB73_Zm00001d049385 [Zea mays]
MNPSSNAPHPHALSPKLQAPGDTIVYLSPAYLLSSRLDIQAAIAKDTELRALHGSLLQSGSATAYNVGAYASASRSPRRHLPTVDRVVDVSARQAGPPGHDDQGVPRVCPRYNIYDNGDEMMEANVQTKLVLCEFVMSNPSDTTQPLSNTLPSSFKTSARGAT